MRTPGYDVKAPKQTVSLTVNSDLYAKAKSAGINVSQVAEQSLAAAYEAKAREMLAEEIRRDLQAVAAYVQAHGSFAELVREHLGGGDGPV